MAAGKQPNDTTNAPQPKQASQQTVPDPVDGVALTGAGGSIVGVEGALRARDVSRPTAADLAHAATLPVHRVAPRPGEA